MFNGMMIHRSFLKGKTSKRSVCTPKEPHGGSVEVMEKGKHLLGEKPMTDTMIDAEKLLQISERAGLNLAVGFVERFNPAILEAKKLIERG